MVFAKQKEWHQGWWKPLIFLEHGFVIFHISITTKLNAILTFYCQQIWKTIGGSYWSQFADSFKAWESDNAMAMKLALKKQFDHSCFYCGISNQRINNIYWSGRRQHTAKWSCLQGCVCIKFEVQVYRCYFQNRNEDCHFRNLDKE